jgi:hypothetical protein
MVPPICATVAARLTPRGADVNFSARTDASEDDRVTTTATKDELLDRAMARTGLSDFGPDGWQEGFEVLVGAIPVDLGDHQDQIQRVENIVVDRLVNRLKIEAWYAEHGDEAAAHEIEGPLMVLGTGRSGTTATHYLLANDPRFRYLRKWETASPVPPPVLEHEADDPRRGSEPVLNNAQHIATVDGPTEDRKVHELSFRESANVLGLPSQVRWWRQADHTAKFPYHERVLRLLQSHRPPYHWLLKSPDDMINLVPLAEHYPDCKFVLTHRDPVKVIPSACSVTIEHTKQRLPDFTYDPADYGRETLDRFHESMARALEARAVIGDDRFVDVGQPELNADPIGIAERIYDFAGLDLSADLKQRMRDWSEQNRAGARGEHKYSPEDYGLTAEQINATFADYLDVYGTYCFPDG